MHGFGAQHAQSQLCEFPASPPALAGETIISARRLGLHHQPDNANHVDLFKLIHCLMLGW
jgi:hypothetical protein